MSEEKKKNQCDIIQDLLPLYQDHACSEASRSMIEEHLAGCGACRKMAEKLNNTYLDDCLSQEKDGILKAHAKKERKNTVTVGLCTAGVLMIPVIVCLICNLAVGHGLDWFFIVLASLLVAASVTVVPLVVQEHTGLWTLGGFTVSLTALLLVIALYSGGNWFFLAAVPALFGLSVVFMPYVVHQLPLPGPLSRCKGLIVMVWDTLWLYALIVVCGLYAGTAGYWHIAPGITTVSALLPWALFLIIRYLRVNGFVKAGIAVAVTGIFMTLINDIIQWILGYGWQLTIKNFNLFRWNSETINANVYLLILITSVAAAVVLACIGIAAGRRRKGGRNH